MEMRVKMPDGGKYFICYSGLSRKESDFEKGSLARFEPVTLILLNLHPNHSVTCYDKDILW